MFRNSLECKEFEAILQLNFFEIIMIYYKKQDISDYKWRLSM